MFISQIAISKVFGRPKCLYSHPCIPCGLCRVEDSCAKQELVLVDWWNGRQPNLTQLTATDTRASGSKDMCQQMEYNIQIQNKCV